jgi:Arc/MetJ-type ribon-helix-helix transcriptional regulator
MAYIKKRGEYWRAEVRRKGDKPTYRTFDTQAEAQKWARRVESEIDTGYYVDHSEAERTTLRKALERYRKEIASKKRHPKQENGRIDRWLRNDLCFRILTNLKGADFARYRDERRDQGRAENTIRLELQLISRMVRIPIAGRGAENKGVPAVLPLSMLATGVLMSISGIKAPPISGVMAPL